jgi:hypothetical protein
MNFPRALGYDPTMAWVDKVREDGQVTADLFIYMDDRRPNARYKEECWQDGRKSGSTCN